MSSFFPLITYNDVCQTISEIIVNLNNIGANYNNNSLVPIYMKKDYNYPIDVSSTTNNAKLWWQARYSMNTLFIIRIPSDNSAATISSIKKELVNFLNSYGITDTSKNVTSGSFLPLVHLLVWFLSCKIVCHTSQQQFSQTPTGTITNIETKIHVCYDNLISTISYIKDRTGWNEQSKIKPEELKDEFVKEINSIDFERIINALVYAFKATYKFSGTYYDFNLLGGKPGSTLTFEITPYIDEVTQLTGPDRDEFEKNLIKHTSIEYVGGDNPHDILLTAPNTTTNYYFNYWKTPSEIDEAGEEKEITTLDLKIGINKLYDKNKNPKDSNWFARAFYIEKADNTLSVDLRSEGKFVYDSTERTVTANIVGEKSSLTYSGCTVTKGNNSNPIIFTGSGSKGFSINSNGVVTCENKGNYVVTISQNATDKIKKFSTTYTVIIIDEKLKLTTSMFTFVAPSSPTYGDASKNVAAINLNSGYSGVSPFRTVQYAKLTAPMSWTSNAPTLDGTYVCRLIVDNGTVYDATGPDGLYDYDNWKFTVPAKK